MSAVFTIIDLSKLPPPKLVEELDYETIFQEMLAFLKFLDPTFDALIESDPAYKILQVCAYRELLLHQKANDKAKARMLAYATGADLDHVGADNGVARLDDEEDEAYRSRIALRPESFSTAGPAGAYRFHALSAHAGIKDISVSNPAAGVVQVAVLSLAGDGRCFGCRINKPVGYAGGAVNIDVQPITAAIPNGTTLVFESGASFETDADFALNATNLTGLLTHSVASMERGGILPFVEDILSPDEVRPMNDIVSVIPAAIIAYQIEAELTLYDGPDSEVVRQAAEDAALVYTLDQHKIGRDIAISGLMAALHQPGVQNVALISPVAHIEADVFEAAYCTQLTVTAIGRDE